MSHSNSQFVARPLADEFFEEPSSKEPDFYADWCLTKCRQLGIDLFWPSRGAANLAAYAKDFESQGTHLMVCATPETIEVLNDKAVFYSRLADSGLGLPWYREVKNQSELKAAVEELLKTGVRVCLKPPKSIYGLGFKIISESTNIMSAYLASDPVKTTLEEALEKLNVPEELFPRLLVMELLPGPEYSVDCLAREGRLLKASIRKKPLWAGHPERLIYDREIIQIARNLTENFRLNNIFNLQLMDSPNGRKLLEINPRMAGGLYYSCLAGINYPYWAVRLALGASEDLLPDQIYDLQVTQVYQPFIYDLT
jgi:predicted ATP-grasp superfamily ATP-dependent carboligase